MIDIEENKSSTVRAHHDVPILKTKSIYKIKYIHWRQKDLLYPDVESLLAIVSELGDEFNANFTKEESKFFQFAQVLLEKKMLPRLFALILEPANSNPIRTLLNKYWMKKYNLNAGNVIDIMTTAEWREVLADFFIESSQWIKSWLRSVPGFGLENSEMNSSSLGCNLMKIMTNNLTQPSPLINNSTLPAEEDIRRSNVSDAVHN